MKYFIKKSNDEAPYKMNLLDDINAISDDNKILKYLV